MCDTPEMGRWTTSPFRSAEVLARAVLKVLSHHVTAGEVEDVKAILPADLRDLWPGEGAHPII